MENRSREQFGCSGIYTSFILNFNDTFLGQGKNRVNNLNLAQFRNDPDLAASWATEMRTNKLLQLVIQTLEDSHPDRFGLEADTNLDVSPTMAGIQLGKSRGYSLYAGRLKMLAEPLTSQEKSNLPESEYKPEEPEEPMKRKRGRPRKT